MDPEVCIQRIESNIRNADIGEAIMGVGAYYNWRLKGGFEPPHGDERVAQLVITLADIAE